MLISVVTINYNDATGLERTLTSVLGQTYPNIEYIVIDGGSSDGSVGIIKKHADERMSWISEKDTGVYNAMNKGIERAKGEYVLFLNSGDYLLNPEIISNALNAHRFQEEIIYGNLTLAKNASIISEKKYPDTLTFLYFFQFESLPHPASFIKRSLFDKVGMYNEQLSIVSDWEFYLKAIFITGATYFHLPLAISVFDLEGVSSHEESKARIQQEKEQVYQKYFSRYIDDYRKLHELINYQAPPALTQRILRKVLQLTKWIKIKN